MVERKLIPKWLVPYKVKEVIWDRSVYILENLWDGTRVQRAVNKVKPYYGNDPLIVKPEGLILPPEDAEEDEVDLLRSIREELVKVPW